MHINTDSPAPPARPKKACIRDLHELVTKHLPEAAVVKVTPLKQLKRRLREIENDHPHLVEETPLVLAHETRRRAQHQRLQVVGSRTKASLTTSQAYLHA